MEHFIFQNVQTKLLQKNANRRLNKSLRREVKTLDLYWFTHIELHLIFLYTIVKGSTNQNLITKQVFCPTTSSYTSIFTTTSGTILDSP